MTPLTFAEFARVNRARCERWHPNFPADGWTGADWAVAMVGEAGEVANVVKKLRRDDFGVVQAAEDDRAALVAQLCDELGDVLAYADLLAQFYGLDLATCVAAKFNAVSDREGFPEKLPTPRPHTITADEWNGRYPIGTPVNAYPGSRDGRVLATVTRSTAWTLPSLPTATPVVLVEGHAGGIALTHVDPLVEVSNG